MNIQNHLTAFPVRAGHWAQLATRAPRPVILAVLLFIVDRNEDMRLKVTKPSQDGQNWTFFILRFQHIFMSELISAREVFLLNEVVVVPVRFKLSFTPYYPGGMFQKTLTPIIILQGFVHCRSYEVQGRYLQIATHNALLTPRKLIFLPTLPSLCRGLCWCHENLKMKILACRVTMLKENPGKMTFRWAIPAQQKEVEKEKHTEISC